MEIVKDYTASVDAKKRVTIRGALYKYYNVTEYKDGSIYLEPRELIVPKNLNNKNNKKENIVK